MISREMSKPASGDVPQLSVMPAGSAAGTKRGNVRASWRLTNVGSEVAQILETWLPHGRFFGERQSFEPALDLPAGQSVTIERDVRYDAAADETVENAFLNLRLRFQGELWRILVRMRAQRGAEGAVVVTVEAVTAHRIGFAQPASARQIAVPGR